MPLLEDFYFRIYGPGKYPKHTFGELLTDHFIAKNTPFSSFLEMVQAGGIYGDDDFFRSEWDSFVREKTGFDGWESMYLAAIRDT